MSAMTPINASPPQASRRAGFFTSTEKGAYVLQIL